LNLKRCITVVVSLLIMATCTVDSVCAWQHPFHERAARISQSTLRDDYMINWNGVFMGTKDPDRKREDCPWINQSHKRDHWRIKASTDAAVKTLRNHVDPTLAGRRLGRAFHYLQDQTEAQQKTKDRFSQVFPRSQFGQFRDAADLVLASIENHSRGIASGPLSFSKYWKSQTREYSNYHDWSQIYSAVDNLRIEFDRKMNNAMNAAPDRGPAIEVFHWYFASLVALQNQIVQLYVKDLMDTKTFLNQLGQSQPQPGDLTTPYSAYDKRTPNISGSWNSSIRFSYSISQSQSSFNWTVTKPIAETASGTIRGKEVEASWKGKNGQGSAKGTVTKVDSSGRATEIRWSNGVIFMRD
jgi:hypothetical protein